MYCNSKTLKRCKVVILTLVMLFTLALLSSCVVIYPPSTKSDDIVVLYTNDIHANYTENIGYSGLSAYKKQMKEENEHVALVDLGDAIQGDLISLFTKGQNVVGLMNAVGYDFAVLGNHEFDFGLDALADCVSEFDGNYITANIDVLRDDVDYFKDVLPYKIVRYDGKKVAYIGLATPFTISSSTPTYFIDEDGNYIVNFWANSEEYFFEHVQEVVDEVHEKGADHVVICGHLGDDGEFYSSRRLIKNITGVDVVLDGHAHNKIEQEVLKDKENSDVILSSTGTALTNIGKLTISADGEVSTELISSFEEKDPVIDEYINNMKAELDHLLNKVVTTTNNSLSIYDEEGVRMVRSRETTIGNLCADALRVYGDAQVGFINGGGVRSYLPSGKVTYGDLYDVFPFDDGFVTFAATGQMILDALELSVSKVQKEYKIDGYPVGEDGRFLQVSGLKFEVDTSIPSSVVLDENEMFVEVAGERRVKNVYIYNEYDEYVPINPNSYYLIASTDYLLLHGGGGYSMFEDSYIINYPKNTKDIEVLVNYLNYLKGDLSNYQELDGRITIK